MIKNVEIFYPEVSENAIIHVGLTRNIFLRLFSNRPVPTVYSDCIVYINIDNKQVLTFFSEHMNFINKIYQFRTNKINQDCSHINDCFSLLKLCFFSAILLYI